MRKLEQILCVALLVSITTQIYAIDLNAKNYMSTECPWRNPDMTWKEYISKGTSKKWHPFIVYFSESSGIDDDLTFHQHTDPLGAAWKGDGYFINYEGDISDGGVWHIMGYDESIKRKIGGYIEDERRWENAHYPASIADPNEYQINIMGHIFSYNESGEIFDPAWGLVGAMECDNRLDLPFHVFPVLNYAERSECKSFIKREELKNYAKPEECIGPEKSAQRRISKALELLNQTGISEYLIKSSPWCSVSNEEKLDFATENGVLSVKSNQQFDKYTVFPFASGRSELNKPLYYIYDLATGQYILYGYGHISFNNNVYDVRFDQLTLRQSQPYIYKSCNNTIVETRFNKASIKANKNLYESEIFIAPE